MKNNRNGQVLPFCMILICVLLWFLFSNFEIGFQNFKKIENQKKLDSFALDLSTQYARGYNALAALNDGLKTVALHAEAVATIAVIVNACGLFIPICSQPAKNLDEELPGFYRKVTKLGKVMADQQDAIAKWMINTQCTYIAQSYLVFGQFHMYPKYDCFSSDQTSQLPFYRPNNNEDEKIKGINKCNSIKLTSFNQFKTDVEKLDEGKNEVKTDIQITYVSTNGGKLYKNPANAREATLASSAINQREGDHYINYHFDNATMKSCVSFNDIFHSVIGKLPELFDIPAPLIFKNEFFEEKNKLIMIAMQKLDSPIKEIHGDVLQDTPNQVWSLSEVKIDGTDFSDMKFSTALHSVSLVDQLSDQLDTNVSFHSWPNIKDLKNEIHH